MRENTHPYSQLHKLSAVSSAEELERFLNLIWKTRKNGLNHAEKSSVQSLLNLLALDDVDPVLVCIRMLLRTVLQENFVASDTFKLFPADLSMHLQRMLVMLFEKYHKQWKEEQSTDQRAIGHARNPYRVNTVFPPHLTPVSCFNANDSGACTPSAAESGALQLRQSLMADACSAQSLESAPHLQSMTWTLRKPNTAQADREAIVCLKLQDNSKSPSGEIEVTFRLARDTTDAIIRSLDYVNGKLSNFDLVPQQKQQRPERIL